MNTNAEQAGWNLVWIKNGAPPLPSTNQLQTTRARETRPSAVPGFSFPLRRFIPALYGLPWEVDAFSGTTLPVETRGQNNAPAGQKFRQLTWPTGRRALFRPHVGITAGAARRWNDGQSSDVGRGSLDLRIDVAQHAAVRASLSLSGSPVVAF